MQLISCGKSNGALRAILLSSAIVGLASMTSPAWSADDAFGNSIIGSDQDSSIPTNLFTDISGIAPLLASGDDVSSGGVPIRMVFPIYGNNFTVLNFATNGYVSTDPADTGPDLSNDAVLPTAPSTGSGDRIYAHHDDTEANIYGMYYTASTSPLGTELFAVQYDACHFNCTPGVNIDIQYNVYFLGDGTVIIAHNLAGPETGSGATVGLQNAAATIGVAYSANTAGSITNGQTVVIIPPNSGISADLAILAAEAGASQSAQYGRNIHNQAVNRFSFGLNGSVNGAGSISSKRGLGGLPKLQNTGLWFATLGDFGFGDVGPDYDHQRFGFQFGADGFTDNNILLGLAGGLFYQQTSVGMLDLDSFGVSLLPYAAIQSRNWVFSATGELTYTNYSDLDLPFINNIEADGFRFALTGAASGQYEYGNFSVIPGVSLTVGHETIDNWSTAGGLSRSVSDVSYIAGEFTTKIATEMYGMNTYVIGGVDFVASNASNAIALYSTNHGDRVGGVAGVGLSNDMGENGLFSAEIVGRGIGSDITSINAFARWSKKLN